jgi:hypothetical protein
MQEGKPMSSSNDGSRSVFKTVIQWAFTLGVVVFLFLVFVAVPNLVMESYSRLSKSITGPVDAILNAVATAWLWFVVAIVIVALVWGFVERHRPPPN